MASAEAAAIIGRLRGAGLTNTDIARVIGRDQSMVSQIARGARSAGYGANIVPALNALERRVGGLGGGAARSAAGQVARAGGIAVARRQTGRGREARVREGIRPAGPRDANLPGGYVRGSGAARGAALWSMLARAESTGQTVYIKVTGQDGRAVGLGERSAEEWRDYGLERGAYETVGEALEECMGELGANGELSSFSDGVENWTASLIAA